MIITILTDHNTVDYWGWIQRLGPLITLVSVVIGVFGTDYMTKRRELHKRETDNKKLNKSEEKNKNIKLNAALVALENSRIILLTLKHEFITPYQKQLKEFFDCKEEDLLKNWNKGCFDIIVRDQSYPRLNNFLYDKVLDFIALERSPYLLAFSGLQGQLDLVNELINKRNEFLNQNKELLNTAHYIDAHESICTGLEMSVDFSLSYIVLCNKYLNEYATIVMPNIKLAKASVKTNYEEDMPTEDLLNNLDQLIQQVIKP